MPILDITLSTPSSIAAQEARAAPRPGDGPVAADLVGRRRARRPSRARAAGRSRRRRSRAGTATWCVSRGSSALDDERARASAGPRSTSRSWTAADREQRGDRARGRRRRARRESRAAVAPAAAALGAASASRSQARARPSSAVEGRVERVAARAPSSPSRRDEEEARELDEPARRRPLGDERRARRRAASRSDITVRSRQVVDRRVRDLREALPEVRRERPRAAGERRDRACRRPSRRPGRGRVAAIGRSIRFSSSRV